MDLFNELVKQFVDDAIQKHDYFKNIHEFESVLGEEIFELGREFKKIQKQQEKLFIKMWKEKDTTTQEDKIINAAKKAITEALQVWASCEKYKLSKFEINMNKTKNTEDEIK